MKLVWNSLLLTLNLVLLPAGTSAVLATTIPTTAEATADTTSVRLVVYPKTKQLAQATDKKQPNQAPNSVDTDTSLKLKRRLEETQRVQKMLEADRLYLGGQFAAAEKIYREVKTPTFTKAAEDIPPRPAPINDPAQLSPAGRVYWREAEAGAAQKLQTRQMVPLRLLVEQYPQFIPGQIRLAAALQQYDRPQEALEVLERATTLYPEQPDLVKTKVAALAKEKKWMEASLAARQYAILNYHQPDAPEMTKLAEENLERYKKHLRSELRGNAIANVITGALGYALTGSLLGPVSAIQTGAMLLRGESAIGESVAEDAREQLEMVNDPAVVNYVNEVGQKLAHVAGRNDFKYEFYVVKDDSLNAFALPGGKVFVNAGAIAQANSEAELAGLLAHELSHAVLSHGFQLVAEGNLLANVTQYVPYGGTLANVLTMNYSRDMERQADMLGTRLIASTGYAADGLLNLMGALKKQEKVSPPSWLSSHPDNDDRIRYIEDLIQRHRYNRYAFEGVGRHAEIKERVKKILAQKEPEKEKKHQERMRMRELENSRIELENLHRRERFFHQRRQFGFPSYFPHFPSF